MLLIATRCCGCCCCFRCCRRLAPFLEACKSSCVLCIPADRLTGASVAAALWVSRTGQRTACGIPGSLLMYVLPDGLTLGHHEPHEGLRAAPLFVFAFCAGAKRPHPTEMIRRQACCMTRRCAADGCPLSKDRDCVSCCGIGWRVSAQLASCFLNVLPLCVFVVFCLPTGCGCCHCCFQP